MDRVLPSCDEGHYVRSDSITRVVQALNSSTNSSVVLIHGGPGTGKSSLASYIASNSKELRVGVNQVYVVPCGKKASVLEKQLHLLHLLNRWPQPQRDLSLIKSYEAKTELLTGHIANCLEGLAALIVLDDVWEPEILKAVVAQKSRCKFLITAQRPRLCRDAEIRDAVIIPIHTINSEEGLKIFLNRLGPDGDNLLEIDLLKDVVDDMMCATNYNPLIIDNLSSIFKTARSSASNADKGVREVGVRILNQMRRDLGTQLIRECTRVSSSPLAYPRGFWSSMELLSTDLSDTELEFLRILVIFDGTLLPEFVMKEAWDNLQHHHFAVVIENLSLKGLIRVKFAPVPSWQRVISMHHLRKQYFLESKSCNPTSLLDSGSALRCALDKSVLLRALWVIYGRLTSSCLTEKIPQLNLFSSPVVNDRMWITPTLVALLATETGQTKMSAGSFRSVAEKIISHGLNDGFGPTFEVLLAKDLSLGAQILQAIAWTLCGLHFYQIDMSNDFLSALLQHILVLIRDSAHLPLDNKSLLRPVNGDQKKLIEVTKNILVQGFVQSASKNNKDVRNVVAGLRHIIVASEQPVRSTEGKWTEEKSSEKSVSWSLATAGVAGVQNVDHDHTSDHERVVHASRSDQFRLQSTDSFAANILRLSCDRIQQLSDTVSLVYDPGEPALDMVFFHGLQLEHDPGLGVHLSTWTCRDDPEMLWPQHWLRDHDARIFFIRYDASLKMTNTEGRMDLTNIAEFLCGELDWALVKGQETSSSFRPIVFVGHSFGGLVIKQLCLHAAELKSNGSEGPYRWLEGVEGILFCGTPHYGSNKLAGIAKRFMNRSPLMPFVKLLCTQVGRQGSRFRALYTRNKWEIFSIGEMRETNMSTIYPDKLPSSFHLQHKQATGEIASMIIVEEASARLGENFIMVAADHISLCRAERKSSNMFQFLLELIDRVKGKVKEQSVHMIKQP